MTTAQETRYLNTAAVLGRDIAAAAIWHGDRCNLIGALPEERPGGGIGITYQALGPDLYGGTAGVGLVLGEIAALTGDRELSHTALGLLRHAASRVEAIPPAARKGLYAGSPGIAIALARAGLLLDAPELTEAATQLAEPSAPEAGDEYDLVSGSAGAVVALLTLRSLLELDLLDAAVAEGEALLGTAEQVGDGWSWRSPSMPSSRGLAGLSHGASGVGLAFHELAAATGEEHWRDAADRAFAYERGLYDPTVRNWPDLRETSSTANGGGPVFATFWCHGAPGIALARLRACELTAAEPARAEAVAALETTSAWVRAALNAGTNYSLCHGLAGNAEICGEGAPLAGEDIRSVLFRTADEGIERYGDGRQAWPCGIQGGSTPVLFLGTAGIARFYLRIAHPEVPSLLLPRPGDLGRIPVSS
jgi:lantibiotic modifying enzyme